MVSSVSGLLQPIVRGTRNSTAGYPTLGELALIRVDVERQLPETYPPL